jgi:hypothetical protein
MFAAVDGPGPPAGLVGVPGPMLAVDCGFDPKASLAMGCTSEGAGAW